MKKPYRPFQISCGLQEGYGSSNPTHTVEEARQCIQGWIERRMREKKKLVAGTLLRGEFIYPWTEDESITSRHEPSFQYTGMVREDATDEEGIEILEDLAREFAETFKQKRVHIVFVKEYYVIENEE